MMDTDTRMIQQIYKDEPWKLLVGCIMLNQTNNQQVRPVIKKFFEKYPNPVSVINADINEMVEMLRPLGLYNRRARALKNFSEDWIKSPNINVSAMRGIGKYAKDSYDIFIMNKRNVDPTDKVLIRFLKEN